MLFSTETSNIKAKLNAQTDTYTKRFETDKNGNVHATVREVLRGEPFKYEDFTEEQLAALKGAKGDTGDAGKAFEYSDFTPEQLAALKGAKGETGKAFEYGDFTPEQLAALKGAKGDTGKAFEYSDFTPEQLAALKGEKGDNGDVPVRGIDYYTDEDVDRMVKNTAALVTVPTKVSELENDAGYANTEYVDNSIYSAMHRLVPTIRLETHQRNFTTALWKTYGATGHYENWSAVSNYTDFSVGSIGVLYGTNTTTGQYVALVGEVVDVSNSLRMKTLACYQTDEYAEITEYGVDVAKDLMALEEEVANKADTNHTHSQYLTAHQSLDGYAKKTDIPTMPTKVSSFENDAGYAKESAVTEQLATKADAEHTHFEADITPLSERTFENVKATGNTQAGGTFFFGSFKAKNLTDMWTLHYQLEVSGVAGTNYQYMYGIYDVTVWGYGATYLGHYIRNQVRNTSYRAIYYHSLARINEDGFAADCPYMFGASVQSAYYPTTVTRTYKIKLLEAINCEAELYDEPVRYADSGYSTTNYVDITQNDAYTQGMRATGDSNTNTYDRTLWSVALKAGANAVYGTQLILSADGKTFDSISGSRSTAKTKTMKSTGFNPEFLFYYALTTTMAANGTMGANGIYNTMAAVDMRYSFNLKTNLTTGLPIYLETTFNADDGLYYLTSNVYTQEVPEEENGNYYIYIGYANATTKAYLDLWHPPVYKYYAGAVRTKPEADLMEITESLFTAMGKV